MAQSRAGAAAQEGVGSYVFITVSHFHGLFHRNDYIINNISFSWPEISEVAPEPISWICVELYISPTQPPLLYPWPGFACSLFLNVHLSLPPSSSLSSICPLPPFLLCWGIKPRTLYMLSYLPSPLASYSNVEWISINFIHVSVLSYVLSKILCEMEQVLWEEDGQGTV